MEERGDGVMESVRRDLSEWSVSEGEGLQHTKAFYATEKRTLITFPRLFKLIFSSLHISTSMIKST